MTGESDSDVNHVLEERLKVVERDIEELEECVENGGGDVERIKLRGRKVVREWIERQLRRVDYRIDDDIE